MIDVKPTFEQKEEAEDKIKRLNFYETSFSCLSILMTTFDEDIQSAKRKKEYDVINLLSKYTRSSISHEIYNSIRIALASKVLNIKTDDLIEADISFEKKDEIDIIKDTEIVKDVFTEYVYFRLKEAKEE